MSGDVHFVLIKDFQHKKKLAEVVAWLEENVVLGHGEAQKVDRSLPFEIPMGFPSRQEAEEFSLKLRMLGCVIATESLSERKARAAREAEARAQAEIESAAKAKPETATEKKAAKQTKQPGEDKQATDDSAKKERPRWLIPAAATLGVVVVALIIWMGADKVDTKAISEWSDKVDMDLISMLQSDSTAGSPFSQVVSNMQRHIEKQSYTQEERVDHSNTYMWEVQGEQPVKNREARKRNILLIQASIGFYRKNRKAWKRLVDEYAAIGANLKIEEIRKEMVEIFGEAETAEILEESE